MASVAGAPPSGAVDAARDQNPNPESPAERDVEAPPSTTPEVGLAVRKKPSAGGTRCGVAPASGAAEANAARFGRGRAAKSGAGLPTESGTGAAVAVMLDGK